MTSVVDMASAAVDEGIALWYKLIAQGERFHVDEAQLMMVRARPFTYEYTYLSCLSHLSILFILRAQSCARAAKPQIAKCTPHISCLISFLL